MKMGNLCPDRQLISVYHDGELPSPWKEKLESHISGCPSCRKRLEAYRRISEKPCPTSADTADTARERVWRRLESAVAGNVTTPLSSAPPRRIWLQKRISVPVPAAVAAAVLFIVFASFWVIKPAGTAEMPGMILASEAEFDMPAVFPYSDMESVLHYLSGRDNSEVLIIRLPESRNFQQYGEPAIIRAADYSRNIQGWRKP